MPRMLHGLKILDLRKKDIKQVSDFHIDLLRRTQALPSRTAISVVYLLVGALPMEAKLHKRQQSLLFSIKSSSNATLHQLAQRVIGLHGMSYIGYFKRFSDTLDMYNLPNIRQVFDCTPSKIETGRVNLLDH